MKWLRQFLDQTPAAPAKSDWQCAALGLGWPAARLAELRLEPNDEIVEVSPDVITVFRTQRSLGRIYRYH